MRQYDKRYQEEIFRIFENANWIAVDPSDKAYVFHEKPMIRTYKGTPMEWSAGGIVWQLPAVNIMNLHWTKTLVSREDVFREEE
jgi:hypothetical protein